MTQMWAANLALKYVITNFLFKENYLPQKSWVDFTQLSNYLIEGQVIFVK